MMTRVENLHYNEGEQDLFILVAAYLLAIARGHSFNDANKRTALLSALVFLEINGTFIETPISFADYVAEAAQGSHDVRGVTEALRALV